MRAFRLAAVAVGLLFALTAFADVVYPPLTGRVVDDAHVLSAETRGALTTKLSDLESKSSIQLVVATLPGLQGQEIEPFANELFRAWKLGEDKKNNGALLLVAPKEHKVRIEVGYGLEGTLTDAISKLIIVNAIAPRFKAGDFDGGITRGVDDIITTLTTDSSEWQKKPVVRDEDDSSGAFIAFAIIAIVVIFLIARRFGQHGGPGGFIGSGFSAGASSGGWSSSSGSSDSFSGGGGSSGGGGASGDW
jgi:uncharacterized protein